MCIFCGGQCGGMGDMLISLGLPLLALYFFRMKGFLLRVKDKILGRPPREVTIPGTRRLWVQRQGEPAASHPLSPVSPTVEVHQLTTLAAADPQGQH